MFRWEFVRDPVTLPAAWARHHLQGTVPIDFGNGQAPMNDFHLPTGRVALEEVLRFLIHDLGVIPIEAGWDETLTKSLERFEKEFSQH